MTRVFNEDKAVPCTSCTPTNGAVFNIMYIYVNFSEWHRGRKYT